MSDEISLLPENLRGKEEELKKAPHPSQEEHFKMYVPKAEEEDVEIIEVDEGEVGEVLEGEPFLTRLIFKTQVLADEIRAKLFHPRQIEPPPKLPPQFFKPPEIKPPAAISSPPATDYRLQPTASPPKARIVPSGKAPRRVRVIRRVRKPVRVSFIDEAAIFATIDIPRRRFTLILMATAFVLLLGSGYALLTRQTGRANANMADLERQLADVRTRTQAGQKAWEAYSDLEPRLKSLSALLDKHLSPSRVFDALEFYTARQVHYTSFTLSPDGRVVLAATADTFETAARQIVAFEKSGLATAVQAAGYQATYDAVSGKIQSVSFQISLNLDPKVLRAREPLTLTAAQ